MKTKIEIYAVGNEDNKTFDIIKVWNDVTKAIYRTIELSPEEFEEMGYNTAKDWQNFLNTSQNYHLIDDVKLKVKMATLASNGERVIMSNNTRDLGHGGQIEIIYQDGAKGWEHVENLIDIEE